MKKTNSVMPELLQMSFLQLNLFFLICVLVGCAPLGQRQPKSQDKILLQRGVPFLINSLESSEIISSGRMEAYDKATITILEAKNNGDVLTKGSFGIHERGMSGLMTPSDTNKTITFNTLENKWFMCVGQIILAPNLLLPLSSDETLASGPHGATLLKKSQGKEIILLEGEATLIKNIY